MARFYGEIGYMETAETRPGVWEEQYTERSYFGDVVQSLRKISEGENLHQDLRLQNIINVVADAYAYEHFFAIRYVRWMGACWTVTNVEVRRPRLELRLGGVYNGPTSKATPDPTPDGG